ncbi:hypothetical protein BDF14DRAFT_1993061 [Spinellus fusiger]|nr:hypothetical protein BDF14DRAFT_1993061 [Spinellus fusiger]
MEEVDITPLNINPMPLPLFLGKSNYSVMYKLPVNEDKTIKLFLSALLEVFPKGKNLGLSTMLKDDQKLMEIHLPDEASCKRACDSPIIVNGISVCATRTLFGIDKVHKIGLEKLPFKEYALLAKDIYRLTEYGRILKIIVHEEDGFFNGSGHIYLATCLDTIPCIEYTFMARIIYEVFPEKHRMGLGTKIHCDRELVELHLASKSLRKKALKRPLYVHSQPIYPSMTLPKVDNS